MRHHFNKYWCAHFRASSASFAKRLPRKVRGKSKRTILGVKMCAWLPTHFPLALVCWSCQTFLNTSTACRDAAAVHFFLRHWIQTQCPIATCSTVLLAHHPSLWNSFSYDDVRMMPMQLPFCITTEGSQSRKVRKRETMTYSQKDAASMTKNAQA